MFTIDLSKTGLTLNGVFMERIDEQRFAEILGEPRKNTITGNHEGEPFSRTVWIWDDLGFLINPSDKPGEAPSLEVEVLDNSRATALVGFDYYDLHPRGLFTGTFTIKGKPIWSAFSDKQLRQAYIWLEKKIGPWDFNIRLSDQFQHQVEALSKALASKQLSLEEKEEQTKALLCHCPQPIQNFFFSYEPKKVSSGKYKLPKASESDLSFKSFPFKLAVVEELMYVQDRLTPRFDLHDFCADYARRDIVLDDYVGEMIPEVRNWFKKLPIPGTLADQVTQLFLDGGNTIYSQLIPFWDGEDGAFDLKTLTEAELNQFPNLKTIHSTGIALSKKVRTLLLSKGIELIEE